MAIIKRPAPQMPTPTTPPKRVDPISIEVMKAAMASQPEPPAAGDAKSYSANSLGAVSQIIDEYTKAQEEKKRKEMAKLLRGAAPPNPWMPVVTKKG